MKKKLKGGKFRECLLPLGPESFLYPSTHRTVTLPVVLHGCETWSLTLSEQDTERDIWV